jgi:hypothetical protein
VTPEEFITYGKIGGILPRVEGRLFPPRSVLVDDLAAGRGQHLQEFGVGDGVADCPNAQRSW